VGRAIFSQKASTFSDFFFPSDFILALAGYRATLQSQKRSPKRKKLPQWSNPSKAVKTGGGESPIEPFIISRHKKTPQAIKNSRGKNSCEGGAAVVSFY